MVGTTEDAGHHDVIRRNNSPSVQREHDAALAHDRAGE
jgi:hypothetical protein